MYKSWSRVHQNLTKDQQKFRQNISQFVLNTVKFLSTYRQQKAKHAKSTHG